MRHRVLVSVSAVASLAAFLSQAVAPAAAQTAVPRTAWGHPDLQGTWDFRSITSLERPEELGDREFLSEEEAAELEQARTDRNARLLTRPAEPTPAGGDVCFRPDGSLGAYNNLWLDLGTTVVGTRRTSLIIDPPHGRLPALTAGGQRRAEARRRYVQAGHPAESWLDLDAADRCLLGINSGPPIIPSSYNQNMQVFQTPDHVVLLTEMVHAVRVVPLDGRPPVSQAIRQWSGDARGHWEGETLVVETTHFVGERRWRQARDHGTSKSLQLVERITRVDADTLEYEFTVTDPETWTRPWTASIPMRRTDAPLYEYACHEGNYSLPNTLAGQRALEAARR